MSDFVLDSGVIVAAYLPATPDQRRYATNVIQLILDGAIPAVPELFTVEMPAVLIKAKRARKISAATLSKAIAELDRLPYAVHHMAFTTAMLVDCAQRYMLSGYDASYFDLARRLQIPLASLDQGHRSACKAHGVTLMTFDS